MRSYKVLLFAVVLPGLLSVAFFGLLASEGGHEHEHVVRVRAVESARVEARVVARAMEAAAEAEAIEAEVRAALAEVDGELARTRALASVAEGRAVHADRCEHGREEALTLDASSLALLRVDAGSGSLDVQGRHGVGEVVVRARLCASSEELLEGLSAHLERVGEVAELETDYPRTNGWGDRYARIDLTVEVPLGLAADIEDTSGEIRIAGTGDTRIADSSGEIEARGVNGSLAIRDGSGEILLRDIGGDVELVDGSGEIEIVDVAGNVSLTDGSGSVDVLDVAGDVHVRADGSGGIRVEEVSGDFRVDADGSGSIDYDRIEGSVELPRKSRR